MLRQEKSIITNRIFFCICKVLYKSQSTDFKLFKFDDYSTWIFWVH